MEFSQPIDHHFIGVDASSKPELAEVNDVADPDVIVGGDSLAIADAQVTELKSDDVEQLVELNPPDGQEKEKKLGFFRSVAEDLRNNTRRRRLAISLGAAALTYHLFGGAEWTYVKAGTETFQHSSTISDLGKVALVGSAVALTSAAFETISTSIVSLGAPHLPNVIKYMSNLVYRNKHAKEELAIPEEAQESTQHLVSEVGEVVLDTSKQEVQSSEKLLTANEVDEVSPELTLLNSEAAEDPKKEGFMLKLTKPMRKLSLMLAGGAGGYVAVGITKDAENNTFRKNFAKGVPAIKGLFAFNFALGAAVSSALIWSHDLGKNGYKAIASGFTESHFINLWPGLGVVPVIKDPLFWLALYGGMGALSTKLEQKAEVKEVSVAES